MRHSRENIFCRWDDKWEDTLNGEDNTKCLKYAGDYIGNSDTYICSKYINIHLTYYISYSLSINKDLLYSKIFLSEEFEGEKLFVNNVNRTREDIVSGAYARWRRVPTPWHGHLAYYTRIHVYTRVTLVRTRTPHLHHIYIHLLHRAAGCNLLVIRLSDCEPVPRNEKYRFVVPVAIKWIL